MSKVFSTNSSGDVLASIRKLVADEAQQDAPPAPTPMFRSSVRTPDPAAVPFRHTNGARDWLVGAIDEEKRTVSSHVRSADTKPLTLHTPVARDGASEADAPGGWKPRISLTLVNPVQDPPAETDETVERNAPISGAKPANDDTPTAAPKPRFQPWKQEALNDGFLRLDGAKKVEGSKARLLLTPEFRVDSAGEPANFNSPAPRRQPRFTLTPDYSEDSDLVEEKQVRTDLVTPPTSRMPEQSVVPASGKPAADGVRPLDENVLRDVVADVVREELRGALGERITRNVRKLVRSEINRAVEATKLNEQDGDRNG